MLHNLHSRNTVSSCYVLDSMRYRDHYLSTYSASVPMILPKCESVHAYLKMVPPEKAPNKPSIPSSGILTALWIHVNADRRHVTAQNYVGQYKHIVRQRCNTDVSWCHVDVWAHIMPSSITQRVRLLIRTTSINSATGSCMRQRFYT